MPEGAEIAVVAAAVQKKLPCMFEGAEIIENVPGKLHRYSKKSPDNWQVIAYNPFIMKQARTKGKLILLDIELYHDKTPWVLAITLGMEGDLRWNAAGQKHTRLAFIKDQGDLSLHDTRCFGTLRILTPEQAQKLENSKGWDLLKSPMPADKWEKFQQLKALKDKPIGPILLDQKLFSGIGNIYCSESLYQAKIHPASVVGKIPQANWISLNDIAHNVLRKAFELNGTSVIDFTADGVEGQAQQLLLVYMKEKCPSGHKISKMKQGKGSNERTRWFCEICQVKYS